MPPSPLAHYIHLLLARIRLAAVLKINWDKGDGTFIGHNTKDSSPGFEVGRNFPWISRIYPCFLPEQNEGFVSKKERTSGECDSSVVKQQCLSSAFLGPTMYGPAFFPASLCPTLSLPTDGPRAFLPHYPTASQHTEVQMTPDTGMVESVPILWNQ